MLRHNKCAQRITTYHYSFIVVETATYSLKMHYLLLFLLMAVMRLGTSEQCPARCTCGQLSTEYHVTVNCSYQQHTYVPTEFPLDTEYIMFQGNNLATFTFPPFSKLRKLDIQGNKLRTIMVKRYRYLPVLETIILSDNSITYLDAGAFLGMPALKYLDLERNRITHLADGVFSNLNLESLWLTNNQLTTIGSYTFEGSSVVNLYLSGNSIGSPHENAFAPLKASLKRFICNNNRQQLWLTSAAFRGVNLTELSLTNSRLNIDTSFLQHVNTIRLDLSRNRLPLSSLNLLNYTSLSKVQYLRLRNVSLRAISSELLPNSSALRMIDLSKNKIKTVTRGSFKFVTQLTKLLLDNNLLSRLPEALIETMPYLRYLSVSNNRIYSLEASELTSYADGGLRVLNMQSNRVHVIEESLRPLLNQMFTFMFTGNPLHCNCEMRWYRDWLNRRNPNTNGLNDKCLTPFRGRIVDMPDSSFACTAPQFANVPFNQKVNKGDDVILKCSAVGDPAPAVEWTSPTGASMIVQPLKDRTSNKTAATWDLTAISRSEAGRYSCRATNLKGDVAVSVCVGVLVPGSDWTVCDGSTTRASTEMPAQSTKTLRTEMTPPPTETPRTSTKTLRTEMTPSITGTPRASTQTLRTEMTPPITGTPRASTQTLRTEMTPSITGTPRATTQTLRTEMTTTVASSVGASSTLTGVTTSSPPPETTPLLLTILAPLIVIALMVGIHMAFVYIREIRLKRSSNISSGLVDKRTHGTKTKSSGNEMSPLLANTSQ